MVVASIGGVLPRRVRVYLSCPDGDFRRFIFEATGVTDTLDLDGRVLCDFCGQTILGWRLSYLCVEGNRREPIALPGAVIRSDSSRSTSD